MREIKFRAWDNDDYMSSPFTLQDIQQKVIEFTSDVKIMQYTGLKDKNGKEIYESDIVRMPSGNNGIVEYSKSHYGGYKIKEVKGSWYWNISTPVIEYEIIGNKFENPELIRV